MWLLLILGFPVLEIYLLFRVGAVIGVANTFFYLLASAVFGVGLMRTQGARLAANQQTLFKDGQLRPDALLHPILIFVSGAFFSFPGFISDLVGLFLLLPASRHLVAFMMKKKFAKSIRDGSMRFASFRGSGGDSGFAARWSEQKASAPRDVTPVAIGKPLDSKDSTNVPS